PTDFCLCGRYRPAPRRTTGQRTSAIAPTVSVSRSGGSSGYGNVRGEPKRIAYAPANAAATIATSSNTRRAVNTWWCRLNIARGSTGKGPLAQAPGHSWFRRPYRVFQLVPRLPRRVLAGGPLRRDGAISSRPA